MKWLRSRSALGAALTFVAGGAVVVSQGVAALATVVPPALTSPASGITDWPTFHHDNTLDGVSPDMTVSGSNAPTLGVNWMTYTFGAPLASPVVQYDAQLGKTLAYIGNESGRFEALDEATGRIVWARQFGVPIHATATVYNGSVWLGTGLNFMFYKLDASSGATQCSVRSPGEIDGAPAVGTPPAGAPTVYFPVLDDGVTATGLMAIDAATCKVDFNSVPEPILSGAWDSASFAVDKNGRALVLFGDSDPDSSIYAIDASTGQRVWRVQSLNPPLNDFGAGLTVSAPGVNGFADGVVYVPGKDRILYAIDLTTGAMVWTFDYGADTGTKYLGGRSTAALVGHTLVFGDEIGIEAVDAITGHRTWRSEDTGPTMEEVISSPAIVGPAGDQAVAFGSRDGTVRALSLATGAPLWKFQTGGYITSSPADSNGHILIASADGFLYDFTPGGTTTPLASTTTSITAPADQSTISNPNGPITVTGLASDATSLAGVDVAVQLNGGAGPWWNAALGIWQEGPAYDAATLAAPGAASSPWSISVPTPVAGGVLQITARARSTDGITDPAGSVTQVTVLPSTKGPHLKLSASEVAPGYGTNVSGGGFLASEQVAISLPGITLATVIATSNGSIPSVRVRVPSPNFPFGLTALTATGLTSGRVTTAAFYVSNQWTQFGHDTAHTNYQPNDNSLTKVVSPGKNQRLGVAWAFPTHAPVASSPAVVNQVAYVGNQAGSLYAVDTHTGGSVWKYATGGAVTSSPAVDRGLVIVGSGSNVVAVNQLSGTLTWSTLSGGTIESSPAVSGGVVYVGSDDLHLYALSEATGAVLWAHALVGRVRSSPAVDAAARIVVVGDDSGAVTALSISTGNVLWTAHTGGVVDASPLILAGSVYVGSSDGSIYAWQESTGQLRWTRATQGPIHAAAAEIGGALYVASSDGQVYSLSSTNGSVVWSTKLGTGAPVTGLATMGGTMYAETANGFVWGLRTSGEIVWYYQTGSVLSGAPAIVNNAVYVGAGDYFLYCFTAYAEPAL
jgi:outer membrane protein assembly factor BamB